jgi:hypothetical protein
LTGPLLAGARPRFVVHPVLVAAAYVLNQGLSAEAEMVTFIRPLLVAAVFAAALMLVGWAIFRNRWDGGLLATVFLALAVTTFPAYKAWQLLGPVLGLAVSAVALMLLLGIPAVTTLRALRRNRPVPRPAAGALNGFAAILVGVVVVGNTVASLPWTIAHATSTAPTVDVAPPQSRPPDIVVILLDGYPRTDVLERRLGIDNSGFLASLTERGFDVGARSRSNYVFTATTLASLFQMRHLDEIDEVRPLIGGSHHYHAVLRDVANRGLAFAALRSAGYEIVTVPPGWGHVTVGAAADRVLERGEMTDLERSLLEQTWLLDLVTLVDPDVLIRPLRDRLVHAFDHLDAFATERRDRPAFLFVHVPGPHLPLVADADGNPLDISARTLSAVDPDGLHMTRAEYSAAWAGELAYIERRTLQSINALQDSDAPPVIVVMADHGYAHEVQADDIQSRFANLFAAFTPGAPGLLRDAPTPVNLMPRLLNRYLGTDFPLSPDRYFLSAGPLQPLILTEVTDPEAAPAR